MPPSKGPYKFADRAAETRRIIAVDGEGKNLPLPAAYVHPDNAVNANGWHSFTLLAAADDQDWRAALTMAGPQDRRARDQREPTDELMSRHGEMIEWDDGTSSIVGQMPGEYARNYGLKTRACLDFLLRLPAEALVVSFYFSYDTCKLAADLPLANLRELASGRPLPMPGCERCAELKQLCAEHKHERAEEVARNFSIPVRSVEGAGMISGETTIWDGYWIQYIPRKKLTVIDLTAGRQWVEADKRFKWRSKVIVWDVFGFFQKSFVEALRDAKGICPPEVIERIAAMKDQRGSFAELSDERILEYCFEECYYLVKLVRDMLINIERFGLKLNAYDGTGALARAWMKRERVTEYKSDTNLPAEIMLCAYMGGRFEVSELGYLGRLYSFDIRSAYPYIASTLPCLAHGHFRQLDRGPDGLVPFVPGKFSVYLAGSRTSGPYAPFAFRIDDKRAMADPGLIHPKSVYYAHGGQRWVWSNADDRLSEVAVARKHFGADAIPLHDGWVWEFDDPECEAAHRPFKSIPEMYAERRRKKADGPGSEGYDGIEKVIKLLLNSVYGKTAQSVGTIIKPDSSLEFPANTSFIWAGLITSGCRAMILDALMQGDVVSIATDGILSRIPLDREHDGPLTVSKELGDWEATTVEDTYLFQSGVYTMLVPCKPGCGHRGAPRMDADGQIVIEPYDHEYTNDGQPAVRVYKTRGFSRKEIPAHKLIDAWNTHNPDALTVEAEPGATRLVTVKGGIARTNALDYIGQWIESTHKVTIAHNRRDPDVTYDALGLPDESIGVTYGSQPYRFSDDDLSAPYTLKDTWEDVEDDHGDSIEGDFYEARYRS